MTLYGDPDQNPPKIFFVADSTKHLWGDSSWYATWPDLAPQAGKIYVNTSSNITYRWSGSTLVEISKSLALGTTSTTAFPGNRGLQAEKDIDAVTSTANTNKTNITNLTTRVTNLEAGNCWYEA